MFGPLSRYFVQQQKQTIGSSRGIALPNVSSNVSLCYLGYIRPSAVVSHRLEPHGLNLCSCGSSPLDRLDIYYAFHLHTPYDHGQRPSASKMLSSPLVPLLLLVALAQAKALQKPLAFHNDNKPSHKVNLLTQDIIDEIDQLRKDWGIKGASVTVVRHDPVSGDWKEDNLGFGVADRHDNPVTDKVSPRPSQAIFPSENNNISTAYRPSFPSLPTQSFLPLSHPT